jgi:hypothetical protein
MRAGCTYGAQRADLIAYLKTLRWRELRVSYGANVEIKAAFGLPQPVTRS